METMKPSPVVLHFFSANFTPITMQIPNIPYMNDFYFYTSLVTDVFNVFTIYLIMYKSNPSMRRYKYYLLYVRMTSWLFDFVVTGLFRGQILFPLYCCALEGYFNSFLPPWAKYSFGCFCLGLVASSYFMCFFYRHQIVQTVNTRFLVSDKQYVRFIIYIHFLAAVMPAAFYYYSSNNKNQVEEALKQMVINWQEVLSKYQYIVLLDVGRNKRADVYIVYLGLEIGVACAVGYGINLHTFKILNDSRGSMSKQTLKAHRQALIAIILEVFIPATMISIPFVIIFIVQQSGLVVDMTGFGIAVMIALSFHCLADNIVVLITIKSYRAAILSYIPFKKREVAPDQADFTTSSNGVVVTNR